ncbi:hypothetical protein TNCV_2902931 [Trichonephila clavipes]|nr:hypothetical protein TNCV_2902931 [Trichonephila clavipes]
MHPQNQTRKKRLSFIHVKARPHFSVQAQDVMGKLKFTVVPQLSYSSDFAPLYFWLFPKLKGTLKGQRFSTDAEVQTALRKWIRRQPKSFYMDRMKKRIEILNKCVTVNCNLVKK